MNDKESISNQLFLQKHVHIYFDAMEEANFSDEGPLQTLVKHDMTDRHFTNPLKGTVSPLVKIVPGCVCRPRRLESQIQVGNVIPISNYTKK